MNEYDIPFLFWTHTVFLTGFLSQYIYWDSKLFTFSFVVVHSFPSWLVWSRNQVYCASCPWCNWFGKIDNCPNVYNVIGGLFGCWCAKDGSSYLQPNYGFSFFISCFAQKSQKSSRKISCISSNSHNLHVKVPRKYLHDINYASTTTPCYVANYILHKGLIICSIYL